MGVAINLTAHRLPRDNQNTFTMIPNSVLRDASISCKAKAVLCYLIGERDNSFTPLNEDDVWTMTIKGLASAFKESIGSIKRSIDELMQSGYLRRIDVYGENNLRVRVEYELFESPLSDVDGQPIAVKESDLSRDNETISDNIEAEVIETVVENNISADILVEEYDSDDVSDVMQIMKNTLLSHKKMIWIGNFPRSSARVHDALSRVDEDDVRDILDNMSANIRCKNKYILTCLFNKGDRKTNSITYIEHAKEIIAGLICASKNNELTEWIGENYHRTSAYNQGIIRRYLYNNMLMTTTEIDNLLR